MRSTVLPILAASVASLAACSASSENVAAVHGAIAADASYQTTIETVVNPYCQSHGAFAHFAGVGGVSIAYAAWEQPNERGAIVLMPGRTETLLKYCELVYDLRNSGYSIYAMDERGQGLSGRMLSDPQKGYVAEFGDYVTDLETFVRTVVNAKPHAKRYLLAHSMGGAISTAYLEKHPTDFDAAAFSSPMLQINTAPYAEWEAMTIVSGEIALFQSQAYVQGKGPYDPAKDTFETNTVTHSRERWAMNHQLWEAHPEVVLGGPTNQWLHECIEGDWSDRFWASHLTTPLLILQAGQDKIVVPSAEDDVCSRAKDCTVHRFPGAYHEVLQETDDVRDEALGATLQFFAAH